MAERLDFKAIAEHIDITAVAHYLNIMLKPEGDEYRAACPSCKGSERTLQIIPETNSFVCYSGTPRPGKKYLTGDCITLYQHIKGLSGQYPAAKALQELFGTPDGGRTTPPVTLPQKPGGVEPSSPPASKAAAPVTRTSPSAAREPFDPNSYLEKLDYEHDQVRALGLSSEEARDLGVGYSATGFHKQTLVFAVRWPSGEIAGFLAAADVKFPKKLVPPKVVQLQRRA